MHAWTVWPFLSGLLECRTAFDKCWRGTLPGGICVGTRGTPGIFFQKKSERISSLFRELSRSSASGNWFSGQLSRKYSGVFPPRWPHFSPVKNLFGTTYQENTYHSDKKRGMTKRHFSKFSLPRQPLTWSGWQIKIAEFLVRVTNTLFLRILECQRRLSVVVLSVMALSRPRLGILPRIKKGEEKEEETCASTSQLSPPLKTGFVSHA